jgi:hypothetical protein
MRLALCVGSTLLAALAAGCSSGEKPAVTQEELALASRAIPGQVLVLSDDDFPQGCDPDSAARLIGDFATAWNRGDTETVESLLAPPANGQFNRGFHPDTGEFDFQWFVDGLRDPNAEGLVNTGRSPGEVGAYIEGRHELNDRLRLLALRVRGGPLAENAVGGRFAFERTADDIEPSIASGPFHINCGSRTIYFWSTWIDPSEGTPDELVPCKKPDGWTVADERVLACS